MNNNKPFLGDFGTCRILPENKYFTNTCIGTPYYLSPEIIGGDKYNLKVDIYSLGCLFCEIYYNKRPYNANNIYALYKNVLESQKDIVIDTNTKIGKVIYSMIDKESHNRPLINDVINLFSNIYDKNYNKLYKKDEDFYYNVRRYENIPKDINELKIIFDKMKENTILNTNIFPKIINLNSKKKKNISDKKVNNNKNILPSVI
jgi:serine/threonine protein kinase